MKVLDVLFAVGDLFAIFFALIRILGGKADLSAYIWMTVAVLWGIEIILKWKEAKSEKK